MANKKFSSIKDASKEELARSITDLKQESLNLRIQAATGQLENSARIRQVRRELARIQTSLSQRTAAK